MSTHVRYNSKLTDKALTHCVLVELDTINQNNMTATANLTSNMTRWDANTHLEQERNAITRETSEGCDIVVVIEEIQHNEDVFDIPSSDTNNKLRRINENSFLVYLHQVEEGDGQIDDFSIVIGNQRGSTRALAVLGKLATRY